jgi:nucleotide-binding universal stress UspA family protein
MDPELYDKTLKQVCDEATTYLDVKQAEVKAQYDNVSIELVEGSVPFTLIWAVSDDDILVITSRGQGGYKRWALGSVAEKLIREAPCPVFLERGPEDGPEYNQ